MDRAKWNLKPDSESRGWEMVRFAAELLAAALLLLLLTAPSQAQTERAVQDAHDVATVVKAEFGRYCGKSYDPEACQPWLDLLDEMLEMDKNLNPPPVISYDRLTTAEHGQRAEWRERLRAIPVEMRRLLPRVRGEANRRKLETLVEEMARERP